MKTAALVAAAAVLAYTRRGGAPSTPAAGRPPPSPLAGASRADLEAAAERIASARGAPPKVLQAIVDIESNWKADALNNAGSDGANGGAWGLVQLLPRTALWVDDLHPTAWADLDPIRAPFALTLYPEINLSLGASLIVENAKRSPSPWLSMRWLQDIAAMHNSGRLFDDAPSYTRNTYWPRFLAAYQRRAGVV